uniref:Ninein n=1 Tax=Tetraodon nigroviridis TaxID=99883 RepID=H3DPT5_TETNG
DGQEQGNYEERLREVFDSFDASGAGSLSLEELSELCQSLHLDETTPVLRALLQDQDRDQDHHHARVDFEQFKNALILMLSSHAEPPQSEEETWSQPDSPEIQPKFVKGSKRYGRRSTPEFIQPVSDLSEVAHANKGEEVREDSYDSAVPRKRERWNTDETSPEEYEAEGQMRLWNPDEPSTPRGSDAPLSSSLEERLREACSERMISWNGSAGHAELLVLSEHLGLELNPDLFQSLTEEGIMSVEEFVSRVLNPDKSQTRSASTPYRQLKRHHSTQPFDEGGRRIATPSALPSTTSTRLFSTLDDGTGFTPAECILDAWLDEGIENSAEILQALNFDLEGKLSLGDLATALENELLVSKNGIHQAAVASFKAEIRYLLEQVDREVKEKQKILSDLETAEKLKNQLAAEVDEHHSAIEQKNNLNLRKLEQDHKEKLAAVTSELMEEMEQLKQQAGLQREELEAEVRKSREDESFLRDHLSISVKDNRRLEMELLDSSEKLMEAESQVAKLQTSLDNIVKERFGDLDPGSADFFLQEERMKQLCAGYEAQYREMQDRIDELQAELRDFHSLGQVQQPAGRPLSEELESKSPGMESDPGIGSDEVPPFGLSLEAEMMLEQLKDQHLREIEDLRNQLKKKLQSLLEQAELERASLQRTQAEEMEALETKREEEARSLREQLSKAHMDAADLEEQLSILKTRLEEKDEGHVAQMDELRNRHADEIREREAMQESHEEELKVRLEEAEVRFRQERDETVQRLTEQWRKEKARLGEEHSESLQLLLEEEMLRLLREHEDKENRLREQWERERLQLEEDYEGMLQEKLSEEREKLQAEVEEQEKRQELLMAQVTTRHREAVREMTAKHAEEREALSSTLDQLREDIAKIQEALENAEEQRRAMEETMKREREQLNDQWREEMRRQEGQYERNMEELVTENQQLKTELDELGSNAQTTELELSRQLNELHNSLESRDELLAQSKRNARETALLLQQATEEREELLRSHAQLEAENTQMLSVSERQTREKVELLSECDGWKVKFQELEVLLQQVAVDFYLERKELQEQVSMLEESQGLSSGGESEGPGNVSLEREVEASCAGDVDDVELVQGNGDGWTKEADASVDGASAPDGRSAEASCKALDPDGNDSNSEAFLSWSLREEVPALQALEGSDAGKGVEKSGDLESCEEKNEPQDVPVWLPGNVSQDESKDHAMVGGFSGPQEEDDPDVPAPLDVQVSHIDREVELAARSHGDEGADCPPLRLQATEENVLLLEKISLLQQKTEILENLLDRNGEKIQEGNRLLEENYGLKVRILLLMEHVRELELRGSRAADLQGRYEDCLCDNARLKRRNGELEKRLEWLERGGSRQQALRDPSQVSLLDEIDTLRQDNVKFSELLGELERGREILSALPAAETLPELPLQTEVKGQAAAELQDSCAELERENLGLRRAIWALRGESRTLHETTQAQRSFPKPEPVTTKQTDPKQLVDVPGALLLRLSGSEAGRLAEENQLLRQKIAALKEEDLKEAHQELIQKLELLNQTKVAAQRDAETFSKQVSRLHQQRQQLADENRTLAEKDAQNIAEMETLQRQLAELMEDGKKRGKPPKEDRSELAACVSALETELRKALEDTASMEERNAQLSQQLSVLREKVSSRRSRTPQRLRKAVESAWELRSPADRVDALEMGLGQLVVERDGVAEESRGLQDQLDKAEAMVVKIEESLQAVTHQNGCLKADLHDLQHERDLLKHDVTVLRKQLQNLSDKVRSSGIPKPLERPERRSATGDELSRLMDFAGSAAAAAGERAAPGGGAPRFREDLLQSREMVTAAFTDVPPARRFPSDRTWNLLSLPQRKRSSRCTRRLPAFASPSACASRGAREDEDRSQLESLQQENEALKTQMSRLSSQLIDVWKVNFLPVPSCDGLMFFQTLQAQLVGFLPPASPHRMPRVQNRGEDEDNAQPNQQRAVRVLSREERMRRMKEVELSLRNVKLLLREKDAHLKEQLQKNGKADVLIGDLYKENAQLLALEVTEQRQKIAEKKNYLLEEKISSLNKIVRDLNPSPLSSLPFQYK